MITRARWLRIPGGWQLIIHHADGKIGTLTLTHHPGDAIVSVEADDTARELLHLVDPQLLPHD